MTPLLLNLTLLLVAVVVLVLVTYLLAIIVALVDARRSLKRLAGGLAAIRDHTAPLGRHMGGINGGLGTLLQRLLAVDGDLAAIVRVARGG